MTSEEIAPGRIDMDELDGHEGRGIQATNAGSVFRRGMFVCRFVTS